MKVSTILRSGMMMLAALMISTSIFAQNMVDKDPSVELPTSQISQTEDLHDVQFAFPVSTPSTGAVWMSLDTSYWVTFWQNDSVYRYDASGNYIEQFQVPVTGSRSITYDGTNVWFGNATTTITAVNPTTKALVTTVTVPEAARYLTYDATANSGAGGFWLGNWSTDVYQVDMSGNTLDTISTGLLPGSRYGAVTDNISPNGPYVWFFHQSDLNSGAVAVQYNPATYSIVNTIDMNAKAGTAAAGLAGGLFITDQVYGAPTLGAVIQNTGFVGINLLDTTLLTFRVDMNRYLDTVTTATFSTVYVNSSFNGWCGTCNPMSDADGDNIWEVTLGVPSNIDSIEWKFTLDGWTYQENFAGGESCTKTTGAFTNRFALTSGNTDLGTFCWNECSQCPVKLTFEINTANIVAAGGSVSADGIFLAGGSGFGVPGDNPATDADGDGIWEVTVVRPLGFSSHYTFLNGNCSDWSCKENLTGLPCGDPANFNDRWLPAVYSDTTIKVCFGTCDSDGTCTPPPAPADVTFNVNMDGASQDVLDTLAAGGIVYVSGNFNGWPGTDNPLTDNGDGTWSTTVQVTVTDTFHLEWKFQINGWVLEETFTSGDPCTITDPSGQFVNRYAAITGNTVLDTYCWSTCVECLAGTEGLEVDEKLFELNPSLVRDFTNVVFNDEVANQDKQVAVFNAVGQMVFNTTVNNTNNLRIETANYTNGLYFVTVKTGNTTLTKKFVVSK